MSAVGTVDSTTWSRSDPFTFVRTKTKDGITSQRIYSLGNEIGRGSTGNIICLMPSEIGFRPKAAKICAPKDQYDQETVCCSLQKKRGVRRRCAIEKESRALKIISLELSGSAGLPTAPKAFFPHSPQKGLPAVMILKLYDFDLASSSEGVKDLSLELLLDASKQLVAGLVALHNKRMIHRDIHGRNLLFDLAKQQAVLNDFGKAHRVEPGFEPELFTDAKDVFSEDVLMLTQALWIHFHAKQWDVKGSDGQESTWLIRAVSQVFKNETSLAVLKGLEKVEITYKNMRGMT